MNAPRFFRTAISKMAAESTLEGVFAIHKPYGMSSAQVIRDCKIYFNPSNLFAPLLERTRHERSLESHQNQKRRRKIKQPIEVKMGHGGTLDPMATGVLILGVGRGTKSLQNFLGCTKNYETVVVFGASSDSYDRCGHLLTKRPYDHITKEKVEEALASFRGTYQQMPPLFSALKMEGKPLYEYAREGKPIPREIQTREVTVAELEMVEWYEPGTHNHHWPTAEATAAEKQYAEQLWRVEKEQVSGKKMTDEEEAADSQAREEHNDLKRKFEERQDELVVEKQSKKQRKKQEQQERRQQGQENNGESAGGQKSPVMSGALGDLPPVGKGHHLVPPVVAGTPPPWTDKGPPAVRVRMTVTSGFYVRSFAHDLGQKLGSAGMMTELVRSRQGDFVLGSENCLEYDDLAKGEDAWAPKVKDILYRWNQPGGIKAVEKEAQHKIAETEAKKQEATEEKARTPVREATPESKSKSIQEDTEMPSPARSNKGSSPQHSPSPQKEVETSSVPVGAGQAKSEQVASGSSE